MVLDLEKSEKGPQRKKSATGRLLHCCCICGAISIWGATWSTYCSMKELDEETPISKFCSEPCQKQGGKEAKNVTDEMRRKAKDAEWRDPEPAYREATAAEKYNAAVAAQTRR